MNTLNVSIGKDIMLTVDLGKLSNQPDSWAHIIAMGLKNILQDSHSGITKDEFPDEKIRKANSLAIAEKKLESLYNNDVRTKVARSGGQSETDKMMVKAFLSTLPKAERKKLAKSDDSGVAFIQSSIEANHEFITEIANDMIKAENEAETKRVALFAKLKLAVPL